MDVNVNVFPAHGNSAGQSWDEVNILGLSWEGNFGSLGFFFGLALEIS